jgi:hypothetical protein
VPGEHEARLARIDGEYRRELTLLLPQCRAELEHCEKEAKRALANYAATRTAAVATEATDEVEAIAD